VRVLFAAVAVMLPVAAASDPPLFRLKPVKESEIAAARKQAAGSGQALAGIHRDVSAAMKKGKWTASVWRVRVQSPGANAMRFHIANFVEKGGTLRIEAGSEKLAPLRGDPANAEMWTDIVYSDTADILYEPPPGAKRKGKPPFLLDKVSHQFPPAQR